MLRVFLCFTLCPVSLLLPLGASERSLAPSSLQPHFRCPWAFSSVWTVPAFLAISHRRDVPVPSPFCEPLPDSLQCLHVLGSLNLSTALLVWPPQCWEEGKEVVPYTRTPGPLDSSLATCSPLALLNGSVPSQMQGSAVPLVELSPPALDLSMLVAVLQTQNKTCRETDMPEK